MPDNQPFAGRLKQARLLKSARLQAAGKGRYTQEQLGIDAGVAEDSASARINQYEQGKHLPDLDFAIRLADVLDVPLAYLFCVEDELAQLLLAGYQLEQEAMVKVLVIASELKRQSEAG